MLLDPDILQGGRNLVGELRSCQGRKQAQHQRHRQSLCAHFAPRSFFLRDTMRDRLPAVNPG
jgi:hypothetical protein